VAVLVRLFECSGFGSSWDRRWLSPSSRCGGSASARAGGRAVVGRSRRAHSAGYGHCSPRRCCARRHWARCPGRTPTRESGGPGFQDYPNYELLVTARTASDIPPHSLPPRVTVVWVAPRMKRRTSESRTSWRACARRASAPKFWHLLIPPAAFPETGCVRWLLAGRPGGWREHRLPLLRPRAPDFWSLARSVWNAPIAGLLGPGDNPFAWCGSLAIRKERFFELRVPTHGAPHEARMAR